MRDEDRISGGRSMIRLIPLIILILLTSSFEDVHAQRPKIESPSFMESMATELSTKRRELRRMNRSGDGRQGDASIVNSALEQYVVLVEALCNRARRVDGFFGSRMMLAAVTLLEGMPAIESLLEESMRDSASGARTEEIRSLLVKFTQAVRANLSALPNAPVDEPEKVLVEILEPLQSACEIAADARVPNGWWADHISKVEDDSLERSVRSVILDDLEIEDALREEIRMVPVNSRLYHAVCGLVVRMEQASWLHSGARRMILARLNSELEQARLDELSEIDLTRRIDAMRSLIGAFEILVSSPGGRSVASRQSKSIQDLIESWSDQLPPSDPTLALANTVEIVAAMRERESEGLESANARIHAKLSKQCTLAERKVFDSFKDIGRANSPWTDPALVVVLTEPRNMLEALEWLHLLKTWRDHVDSIRPSESGRLIDGLRGLISAMVDQESREDARRALREFERQLNLFIELDKLDDYLNIVGIRDARHSDRLGDAWVGWIRAWSAGRSADDNGEILYHYLRLMSHLRLINATDETSLENADSWSAWELPIDHILSKRASFQVLVEDYASAMADGDWSRMRMIASELEDPFSDLRLIGLVSAYAPSSSGQHPALRMIGQITTTPTHQDLLAVERSRLAAISHAWLEVAYLEETGRIEEAELLQSWLQRETRRLNRHMGLVPAKPLAVPGMREDPTGIGVDSMQMMQ